MHVIQYVATRATSVDEAHSKVQSYLEGQVGTWYDWFVTGGGRWASGEDNQYNESWTGDIVSQDSPKFQEYLDQAHKWKLEATEYDMQQSRKINLPEMLDKIENNQEGMYPMWDITSEMFSLYRLFKQTSGAWDYDSYYYDIEHEASHPTYMRENIDKGDKNWYLVPVDFHH